MIQSSAEWLKNQICWQLLTKKSLRIDPNQNQVRLLRQTKMKSWRRGVIEFRRTHNRFRLKKLKKQLLFKSRKFRLTDRENLIKRLTAKLDSWSLTRQNWQTQCFKKRESRRNYSNSIIWIKIKSSQPIPPNIPQLSQQKVNLTKKGSPSFNCMCAIFTQKPKNV